MIFDEHVHRTMLLGHWMDNGAGIITPCARAAEFPSNMAQRVNKIIDTRRRHDTVGLAFMTQTSDSGLVCVGDPISWSGTVPVSDGRRRGPQVRSGPVFQGFSRRLAEAHSFTRRQPITWPRSKTITALAEA